MKNLPAFDERTSGSRTTFPISLFFLVFFTFFASPDGYSQCDGSSVLNVTNGTTGTWKAPSTGGPFSVRITAIGAGGGNIVAFPGTSGGSGASMIGDFIVQNDETILAIAGAAGGGSPAGNALNGGGGGGSGAVNCGGPVADCLNGEVLIIAAGGNGESDNPTPPPIGKHGLGGSASEGLGNGGAGGGDDEGGGGGGLNENGGSGNGSGAGFGGEQVKLNGLSAGGLGSGAFDDPPVANDGGAGMGGGGGGGNVNSGGGGGHTGGSGDNTVAAQSLNTGTNQSNTNGTNGGGSNNGIVNIVCLGSLPVELINFKAVIQQNNQVALLWSTASEKDNLGYDVERSTDNRNWSQLGFVPGNGTTVQKSEYRFQDEKPLPGVNYYRLKQMDTDGKYQYTPMVVADVRATASEFDVFPNPSANGEVTFRAVSKTEGVGLLEMYDWAGYRVFKENIQLYEGTMIYPVSLATFPKGTYTARLEMPDGQVQFKKILLQ
jgi:hypothetical protein